VARRASYFDSAHHSKSVFRFCAASVPQIQQIRDGVVYKLCVCGLLLALSLSVGCGGGSSGTSNNQQFTPVNIQGQYEVVVASSSSPTAVSLIETNFTQTGTSVFASKQNVVVIEGTNGSTGITLNNLGGECDNGVVGNDSIQGTFSSQTQGSISLTEAGSLGTVTATGNVTFAPDGSTITTGTYNIPAACGFLADSGPITGTQIKQFSGSYAGMLANGSGTTDAVIVTVNQSGLNLTVTGTDNGTAFSMTGSVVGATFDVKGTIAGQPVEDVGIYDHTNNTFLIFGTQLNFLGTLKAGTNPLSVAVPSSLFKVAR
jgi:hypothetical protein